jgi:hypothetical protein
MTGGSSGVLEPSIEGNGVDFIMVAVKEGSVASLSVKDADGRDLRPRWTIQSISDLAPLTPDEFVKRYVNPSLLQILELSPPRVNKL